MLSRRILFWIHGSCAVYAKLPCTSTSPETLMDSPRIDCSRVLFPLPTSPITTTSSPAFTSKLMPLRVGRSASFAQVKVASVTLSADEPGSAQGRSSGLCVSSSCRKSWRRLCDTLALMRFMICMGSMMMGKRRRLKSASAGKATEAVSGSPSAAKTPNAASEMRMGPAVKRIMLMDCRYAAAFTCANSTSRSSLICFWYGSSHAYSLIALMPVTTSVTILIRLSVSLTTFLRTLPISLVT
mmetsp:Transcript_10414/g.18872  ORF Transcript_10414/g.18872 Transcript_10414/m.18872 type:complete len:241 (-) Transcript_10414:234-956(-)